MFQLKSNPNPHLNDIIIIYHYHSYYYLKSVFFITIVIDSWLFVYLCGRPFFDLKTNVLILITPHFLTPIISTINNSLSHILGISNSSSGSYPVFHSFENQVLSMGQATSIIKPLLLVFSIATISGLWCSICPCTWIQSSHGIFTVSFSMSVPFTDFYSIRHAKDPKNVQTCLIVSSLIFFLC